MTNQKENLDTLVSEVKPTGLMEPEWKDWKWYHHVTAVGVMAVTGAVAAGAPLFAAANGMNPNLPQEVLDSIPQAELYSRVYEGTAAGSIGMVALGSLFLYGFPMIDRAMDWYFNRRVPK